MGKKREAALRQATAVEKMAEIFGEMAKRDKYLDEMAAVNEGLRKEIEELRNANETLRKELCAAIKEIAELKLKLQKPLG